MVLGGRRRDGCAGGFERQSDGERGPFVPPAGHVDLPVVRLHDSLENRQAQPHSFPLGFGGEERVKDFRQVFSGNTFTFVMNLQLDALTIWD